MKWKIPAKTFLVGEYAALAGASAILLTTAPCFELGLTKEQGLFGIHPESPAGLWWAQNQPVESGIVWYDPYQGLGGLGASSAQFIGTYLAVCHLKQKTPLLAELLEAYETVSWSGQGLRPSAYDVRAQSQGGCLYINKKKNKQFSSVWPFQDLSFILVHTGQKIPTHEHLKTIKLPKSESQLSLIVDEAQAAFDTKNSTQLIRAVNQYHELLNQHQLVAAHSLTLIEQLKQRPEIRALKGCGALGADMLLLLCDKKETASLTQQLIQQKWNLIADETHLTLPQEQPCLLENNP